MKGSNLTFSFYFKCNGRKFLVYADPFTFIDILEHYWGTVVDSQYVMKQIFTILVNHYESYVKQRR